MAETGFKCAVAYKKASPAVAPGGSENNKQQDRFLLGVVNGYGFSVVYRGVIDSTDL